jgi:hypothetical protein
VIKRSPPQQESSGSSKESSNISPSGPSQKAIQSPV